MTFSELTQHIDKEISEKKSHGKNMWFDINICITGIENQLIDYYREFGYTIELMRCKSCQGQVADILITWNKGS
jgi:hypothetical protein